LAQARAQEARGAQHATICTSLLDRLCSLCTPFYRAMGQDVSTRLRATTWAPASSGQLTGREAEVTAVLRHHLRNSGRHLEDDYEVFGKALLGRGGGGKVVAACGRADHQRYAVKTLDKKKRVVSNSRDAENRGPHVVDNGPSKHCACARCV